MNEVPNDQEVADESSLLQDVELVIEAFDQLGVGAIAVTFVQTLVAKLAQIRLARLAFWCRVFRVFRFAEFQLQIAALRDRERVCNRTRMLRKKSAHLRARFEIQLRRVTHAPLVMHHLPGADANHDIVRIVVRARKKMHIVRCDQAEPEFLRDSRERTIALLLRFNSMIVQFQKEIFRA